MRRTYMTPEMVVVKLQHQNILCSSLNGVDGNSDINYGGASGNNAGGIVRAKESSGDIWDEEW